MNTVETILLENADKPGVLFVFPTDVAASRWADHLLRLRGGGTQAMNRFIAWDTFKQDSIRSRKQDKRSIAPVLRKIFVCRLIRENKELCEAEKPPVFSSLIRIEWARQANSFTTWLTGILPQLGSWFTRTTGLNAALITGREAANAAERFEGDEKDLYTLSFRYAQFLDKHGLFEPAWEIPPFDDTGKECFIFFPESLSDYSEYRELLEVSGHVKPIRVTDREADDRRCDVFFYTNSRSEITEAALYIIALNEREHIPWDSIVVSIPDAENYEPYVLREFANRNIPFVRRIGKPLALYPAGMFFRAVADCVSRDFAFSALTNLILNRRLPWKDGAEIQGLIEFGIKNNCISSWVEEDGGEEKPVNVWEDAFTKPFGGIDPAVRRFFGDLRRRIKVLRGAASFSELRKQYFSFRERFFDMDNCLSETDLVLSRCISELMYLTEIEKSFPDAPVPDPFMFFVEYLGETSYLPQQPASGVVILPYRTSAPVPFECHIILGASQDNLSAVFPRLGFLPRDKREQLNLADEDASAAFINLHKFNSQKPAAFFCPEHTFSGYAIPHSRLGAALKPRRRYGEDPEYKEKFSVDLYRAESDFFQYFPGLQPQDRSDAPVFPQRLHESQKQGFDDWRSRRQGESSDGGRMMNKAVQELIRERFCCNPQFPGKVSVSASSLAPYFNCSLQWFFERVLLLDDVRIEADLMTENIAGQVYHAALNLFFTELKKNGDPLAAPVYSGEGRRVSPALPDTYRDLLAHSVNTIFAGFPCLSPGGRPVMSALSARLLRAEQKHFHSRLEKCLAVFLSYFTGYRVIGTETAYQVERDSFFLNGIIDCILEDAREDSENRGTALIVDFKLRRLPNRADCTGEGENGLANFQLPLYLSLAEENENRPVNTALFFSIIDAEPLVLFGVIQNARTGLRLPNKEDDRIMRESDLFQQIMNEFEKKVEQFVGKISRGEFSISKSEFEKCDNCKYHRVCRTIYKIARDQNLTT
jgi:hypothetical protein